LCNGDYHLVNRLLAIGPHEVSPFDATSPAAPKWPGAGDIYRARTWPRARELRQELIKVAGHPALRPARRAARGGSAPISEGFEMTAGLKDPVFAEAGRQRSSGFRPSFARWTERLPG
jgi:hypothetical protein